MRITFYYNIWGGEDIHIGLYEETPVIKEASARTVRKMAGMLKNLSADTHIIDLGAGYGGSARHLASEYGCSVDCLNISEAQNDTNRFLNRRQALRRADQGGAWLVRQDPRTQRDLSRRLVTGFDPGMRRIANRSSPRRIACSSPVAR